MRFPAAVHPHRCTPTAAVRCAARCSRSAVAVGGLLVLLSAALYPVEGKCASLVIDEHDCHPSHFPVLFLDPCAALAIAIAAKTRVYRKADAQEAAGVAQALPSAARAVVTSLDEIEEKNESKGQRGMTWLCCSP
jgi:hypothetical protein